MHTIGSTYSFFPRKGPISLWAQKRGRRKIRLDKRKHEKNNEIAKVSVCQSSQESGSKRDPLCRTPG